MKGHKIYPLRNFSTFLVTKFIFQKYHYENKYTNIQSSFNHNEVIGQEKKNPQIQEILKM